MSLLFIHISGFEIEKPWHPLLQAAVKPGRGLTHQVSTQLHMSTRSAQSNYSLQGALPPMRLELQGRE
jgi:hypothetical protein